MLYLSPTSAPSEVEFPEYTVTKMTYSERMKNQLWASCLLCLSDIKEICTGVK